MIEEQNTGEDKKAEGVGYKEEISLPTASEQESTEENKVSAPSTLDPKPSSSNMEVHKHPHRVSHKKKWEEYVLEFFMLFFAVFLGFVAENVREGVVESHREKQFMQSLVNDLQLDTAYLHLSDSSLTLRILSIDSTLDYFMAHRNELGIPIKTIRTMIRSWFNLAFFEHNGTVDQLKYSGAMRLISNRKIVDSIESYYQQTGRFTTLRGSYFGNQAKATELQDKLWNAWDHIKYYQRNIPRADFSIIAMNPLYLNEYLNHLLTIKVAAITDKKNYLILQNKAINLIDLIENEYHLEK